MSAPACKREGEGEREGGERSSMCEEISLSFLSSHLPHNHFKTKIAEHAT